ncbi:DUF6879 family protein [Nocardia sp. NPDC004068]|uniref:DUF6879 family protein n=1 Tax=Nocardia sp. NPDC004068 TaxID=3364303 RepID=UPI0036AC5C2A
MAHAQFDAVHLEVRDTYAVPAESEPLRRFLAGEPRLSEPDEYWEAWAEAVKDATARGVTVRRVRVVTEPLSDYQRWLLTETDDNIEAGEDIRYIARHLVREVPADDAWVIDKTTVGFNLVDSTGKPAGAAVTTDPAVCGLYREAIERLWSLATPFAAYVNGLQ